VFVCIDIYVYVYVCVALYVHVCVCVRARACVCVHTLAGHLTKAEFKAAKIAIIQTLQVL
jgi:hypothetical protein